MLTLIKYLNDHIFFPSRRAHLVKLLTPFLTGFSTILDLGSSDGRLAYDLVQKLNSSQDFANPHQKKADIVGVDTHVQPQTYIPIQKYDGKTLPYPNNAFDCIMLIDVLHHAENPQKLLQEAMRVSKKHILIKDHYYYNTPDFMLLKLSDYLGNKPYGVALPYHFLKLNEWESLFDQLGVHVDKQTKMRFHALDPCRHVVYLLGRK